LIKEAPDKNTGIIVVVPSFDEPEVITLLDSLASCKRPGCSVEVIIVVNSPLHADEISLKNNLETVGKAEIWKKKADPFFRLYLINIEKPAIKGWGVGLARKTGMDEALRRFDKTGNDEGVIACLDADCTIEKNYFIAIEKELLRRPERKACSIYFEHPVTGADHLPEIFSAAIQYEMHLRYYLQALRYAGFPYVYHTVGSTLAVKAMSYMKAGGMNRRQAGEDFYFVQKLLAAGGYFSLNYTTVFPSPRISKRVPFGTGAAIGKMVGSGEKTLLTYNPGAFEDLRSFFLLHEKFYSPENIKPEELYMSLPASIRSFTGFEEWENRLQEIRSNTSGLPSFKKRFFEWFNMFRVVKYLNFVHLELFSKVPVYEASVELLGRSGYSEIKRDALSLLLFMRAIERDQL
jgi:glycosyltransferase involved in cell wall biosynthesis